MMPRRRHKPPDPSALKANEVIIGRTVPFEMAPGNPLRAAACLICGDAAGGDQVTIFTMILLMYPAEECGMFGACSWLIHGTHSYQPDNTLATLAKRRHRYCILEAE